MAETDQATRDALATLADLAQGDSGGSSAARSMLVYAWDTSQPIYRFADLSGRHRVAALVILNRAWAINPDAIESIAPQVRRWHQVQTT